MNINCQKCPNCAGNLETRLDINKKVCLFCDSEFSIDSVEKKKNNAEDSEEIKVNKLMLIGYGGMKMDAIKAYKVISGAGLKEAKETIESIPVKLLSDVSKEEAENYIKQFKSFCPKAEFVFL